MLRLTAESPALNHSLLRAEGRVVGEYAALLERECLALIGPGVHLTLDLAAVSDVDQGGLEALRRLRRNAVILLGVTPILDAMLRETPA